MTGNSHPTVAYTHNAEINYSSGRGLHVVFYNNHDKGEMSRKTQFLENGGQVAGSYDGLCRGKTGTYVNYNHNVPTRLNLNIGGEICYYDFHSDYQAGVL